MIAYLLDKKIGQIELNPSGLFVGRLIAGYRVIPSIQSQWSGSESCELGYHGNSRIGKSLGWRM